MSQSASSASAGVASTLKQLAENLVAPLQQLNQTDVTKSTIQSVDALRAVLEDHAQLFASLPPASIHSSLLTLRTSLIAAQLAVQRALQSAKSQPVVDTSLRLTSLDLRVNTARLCNALAHAAAAASVPLSNTHSLTLICLEPGEDEAYEGERFYAAHGVARDINRAILHFSQAAERGHIKSMLSVASILRSGEGREKAARDVHNALLWYKRAADLSSSEALYCLGSMHEAGEGVQRNLEQAIELYQSAAGAGNLEAMTALGYIYEHGSEDEKQYVPVDIDAAQAWYQEAAKHGHAKAQNNLAYLILTAATSNSTSLAEALKLFQQAASSGHSGALYNLGVMYESGKGVERDEVKALQNYLDAAQRGHRHAEASVGYLHLKNRRFVEAYEWLRKATDSAPAAAGGQTHLMKQAGASQSLSSDAFYHLAQMFHHGLHVTRSEVEAFALYQRAASMNHPYATLELAHCHFTGKGCRKDIEKAYALYQQAAQLGVSEAMNSLGIMNEEGVGTQANLHEAISMYQRAAAVGNADAIYNLGLLYQQGKGVERNESIAIEKFREAANLGSQSAKSRLNQMNTLANKTNQQLSVR